MAEDEKSLVQSIADEADENDDAVESMSNEILVDVMGLSGDSMTSAITAKPSTTVKQIKCEIEKIQGIPVMQQRLLLQGTEEVLEDQKTLGECHVSKDCKLILVKGTFYSCAAFVPELSAAGCQLSCANTSVTGQFGSSDNPANYARGPLFPASGKHSFSIRIDGGCSHNGSNDAYVGVASVSQSKGLDKYSLKGAWLWQVEYSRRSQFSAEGIYTVEIASTSNFPRAGDIITVETDMDELRVHFKLNGKHVQTLNGITDPDLQPVVLAFYTGTALTLVE
eukprot:TRINITY_DN68489_c0_g1_i1.p1 TRINITY_DN68489_c0_g1~~TRINITY_DN68489_c0_g1_i1.p1  ORF type:complete len:280 (+),score=56.82 TRINITY_DN68489_c0_g1_i1:96-935(+)